MLTDDAAKLIYHLLHSSLLLERGDSLPHYRLISSERINGRKMSLQFSFTRHNISTKVIAEGGSVEPKLPDFVQSDYNVLVSKMVQSAAVGNSVCLIGQRGEGKTFVSKQFAAALGYIQIDTLFLFEDMTARDLLQRRSTNSKGESIWESTPLSNAIKYGGLCILDGLDRLSSGL